MLRVDAREERRAGDPGAGARAGHHPADDATTWGDRRWRTMGIDTYIDSIGMYIAFLQLGSLTTSELEQIAHDNAEAVIFG